MAQRLGEFEIIARYFAPLAKGAPGAFGLENDAAVMMPPPGHEVVLTTDVMVAGVHYLAAEAPGAIARKLLRVNLSDLAAMGADAAGYLLALALPRATEAAWIEAFAQGLSEDQGAFGVDLLGGDTVATSGPAVLSLTAVGTVPAGSALTRSGARAGDGVYVSGTIGDAALGLAALEGRLEALAPAARERLIARHRLPSPRLALGRALIGHAHAALDVSDGLMADLGHLCAASGLGARIEAERVPLSEPARAALERGLAGIEAVLAGGDDYELLFAAPPKAEAALARIARAADLSIARIGEFTAEAGVAALDREGAPIALAKGGYTHF